MLLILYKLRFLCIRELKNIMSMKVSLMIYYAMFQSKLKYETFAWGSVCNNTLKNLQNIRYNILKIIYDTDSHGLAEIYNKRCILDVMHNYYYKNRVRVKKLLNEVQYIF